MLNFLGLGGLLNYNTSIPHGDPRILPPPPPSNDSGLDSLSEQLIASQKERNDARTKYDLDQVGSLYGSGGVDALKSEFGDNLGDLRYQLDNLNTGPRTTAYDTRTDAQFIDDYYAAQNAQPSEPRSMQDLISRDYPVNRNRMAAYQSTPFFNPMPPMYSNPYVSPFMGGLSMAPYMGGNFGMSGPFGSPMYGGRMGMMGMGLGGCPPTYGF